MYILGFGGGADAAHSTDFRFPRGMAHDAAAVLLEDGEVVAAIEEERLIRIKHTNKAPLSAIQFCLQTAGISHQQVDQWVFYSSEQLINRLLMFRWHQDLRLSTPEMFRPLVSSLAERYLGFDIPAKKLAFVDHHAAHAMSAFGMSGFDSSLVVTWDGQGDGLAGTVSTGRNRQLTRIEKYPDKVSLGWLYAGAIRFLGYEMFDEYKVMGLAPYGDPARFRGLLSALYTLEPNGQYKTYPDRLIALFGAGPPRGKDDEITQAHKDLAASLQEMLEKIAFHILTHFQERTGERRLCLAGGVAHNCTLNGKILNSGLFDEVFVQPASHDAGCALGAALIHHARDREEERPLSSLRHVYWGTDIGDNDVIGLRIERWHDWLELEKMDATAERVADMLAQGKVIGWVQGRSEFGPRALGNRSILADPRPAIHKDKINEMVKKREAYRPFAPSVLAEKVDDYFVVPENQRSFPYMTFVVDVKEPMRACLGAVTHVDGSTRVQTVTRDTNPRYWDLIDAFGRRTGVYVLLNTSFNNNVEPIVDSVEDAIVCFLTTKLDHLVVGDYLMTKRVAPLLETMKSMVVSLPLYVRVRSTKSYEHGSGFVTHYECVPSAAEKHSVALSEAAFRVLCAADGRATLESLMARDDEGASTSSAEALAEELFTLWSKRLLTLSPANRPDE